jgi:hypothetical protein
VLGGLNKRPMSLGANGVSASEMKTSPALLLKNNFLKFKLENVIKKKT